MLTFLCKTQSAPATDIKWFRDGVRLAVNGNTTQMSTRITSGSRSNTDITLRICDNPENTTGVYTCRVGNKYRSDSETIEIKGEYTTLAHLIIESCSCMNLRTF